jgi:hypothetical protein
MRELPFKVSRRALMLAPFSALLPDEAMARRRGGGWTWRVWGHQRSVTYSHAGLAITVALVVSIIAFGYMSNRDGRRWINKPRRSPRWRHRRH